MTFVSHLHLPSSFQRQSMKERRTILSSSPTPPTPTRSTYDSMNTIDMSGFTVNRRTAFGLRASAGPRQTAFGLGTNGLRRGLGRQLSASTRAAPPATGRQPSAVGLRRTAADSLRSSRPLAQDQVFPIWEDPPKILSPGFARRKCRYPAAPWLFRCGRSAIDSTQPHLYHAAGERGPHL